MPVKRRRMRLATLSAVLMAAVTCGGCASGPERTESLADVGPTAEPRWRFPGEGVLAKISGRSASVEQGPAIGDPSLFKSSDGAPIASQSHDTGIRWRLPGTSYAQAAPASNSPVMPDAAGNGKTVAANDGLRWRWPVTKYEATVPATTTADAAPATSDGLPAKGLVGAATKDLKWRWPATAYSAGASANDSAELTVTQPVPAPAPDNPATRAGTPGLQWRLPGKSYPTQSANPQPLRQVSGQVIASAAPGQGPAIETPAPAPSNLPVIASTYRPAQRSESTVLDLPPVHVEPTIPDLSGARTVPIASTGPAPFVALVPGPAPRLTPLQPVGMANGPSLSTGAQDKAPMLDTPPPPTPTTDKPMPNPAVEKAPAPRRARSAIPVGPVFPGFGPAPGHGPAGHGPAGHGPVPKEFHKQSLPPYVVEPPDVLLVESTQKIADQPVRGQHLIRPDGTIGLGIYGSVYVSGMTLDESKAAIASQLAQRIKDFDIKNLNVDVIAYNSKVYYLITDGGGYGEQVYRVPVTGNETVLDALGQINGLPPVASKKNIWVARATPGGHHELPNILPVDWKGITQRGSAATNYQVMPGDRIYVKADPWIRADSFLAKRLSPVERLLGTTLLGSVTVNSIRNGGQGNNNSGGGLGF